MLKEQALKRIFITTLTMFIILTVYTIPTTISKEKVLRTNLEVEDITSLSTDKIYLLNKDGYFVKTEVFIDSKKKEEKIEKIIDYLTIDNNKIPMDLNGYIPKNTKLLDYEIEKDHVTLNFSKELENCENLEEIITGIVYSLLEQKSIKKISIQIEKIPLEKYQNQTKEIGINKEYLFQNRKEINKVVMYYMDKTNTYYVPVTEYRNDNREKIEIIIEELKQPKENLISLENIHTELLDYKEESNVLFLNFNEYLVDANEKVTEKVLRTIAYSAFDNYDVNMVMFEINKESLTHIDRK